MRGGRERNRADAVAVFREDMLAVMATLGGEFDTRIRELTGLKKELDARSEAVRTVEEAAVIRTSAEEYAKALRDSANKREADVTKRDAATTHYEEDLRRREAQLKQQTDALVHNAGELEQLEKDFTSYTTSMKSELAAREQVVKEKELKLAAEMAEVGDLRVKLNERVRALSEI